MKSNKKTRFTPEGRTHKVSDSRDLVDFFWTSSEKIW